MNYFAGISQEFWPVYLTTGAKQLLFRTSVFKKRLFWRTAIFEQNLSMALPAAPPPGLLFFIYSRNTYPMQMKFCFREQYIVAKILNSK